MAADIPTNRFRRPGGALYDATEVPPSVVVQAVVLAEADLDAVVGTYRMGPSFDLTVRRDGGRLFGRATGQSEGEVFASARDAFFSRAVEARFTFERDESGHVVRLVLHQGGRWLGRPAPSQPGGAPPSVATGAPHQAPSRPASPSAIAR